MSVKKWLFTVFLSLFTVFAFWGAVNIAVDPFNAFGDNFLNWDSYTQTLNPRNSKAVYVSENFDRYDSYVIGSSTAASFLPETLNSCVGGSFYNMFHYGADTEYDRELVSFLLENDEVEHVFLVLGINEANKSNLDKEQLTNKTHYSVSGENPIAYYMDYLFANLSYANEKVTSFKADEEYPKPFDVFIPETGVYDKRVRDAEEIGDVDAYIEKNGDSFASQGSNRILNNIDKCVENVSAIKKMCEAKGAKLTVVIPPVAKEQLESFTDETVNEYFNKLASVTDYWNFAVSEFSYDPRYFYDSTHTRNATANMVIARIFQAEDMYFPQEFGTLCTGGYTADVHTQKELAKSVDIDDKTVNVPILMYHHLSGESTENKAVVSQEVFRHQMQLLKDNGYEAVSFADLVEFTKSNKPLPEKPVIITFDDGYQSNYEYAFPVLEELNMKGTIFAIGVSIGKKDYYKETNHKLTPHFGKEEIAIMEASGLITIGSHTYDMHQWAPFEEGDNVRESVIPLEGESDAEFINALKQDVEKQNTAFAGVGLPKPTVIAFPNGKYIQLCNVVLRDCGYNATLSTDATRINTVIPGMPQSLYGLGRMSVDETVSDQALLDYLAME